MRIVLIHPQIPQNTGNIVRTCSVTGTSLTLITPLGFSIDDKMLKRAGLDYWEGVDVKVQSPEEFIQEISKGNDPFYFFSSKTKTPYTDIKYEENSLLIFGAETVGLPSLYWEKWPNNFYTIPMVPNKRCLNLATSAAIVVYEASRQLGFSFSG